MEYLSKFEGQNKPVFDSQKHAMPWVGANLATKEVVYKKEEVQAEPEPPVEE